jgi:signal transduction histidine kinase/ligand-binding sensor domain-containing protein/DNA-binding response OmpR family regulator
VGKKASYFRFLFWLSGVLVYFLNPSDAIGGVSSSFSSYYANARFKTVGINEGLSQSFISSIYQDHLGFIWIGTKDGLNLYDGYRFKTFKHDPFNLLSISDNYIKAIYSDRQGRLWVGTMNGGLNVFDRQTETFVRFAHDPDNPGSISSNNVQEIVCDEAGNIWIGTAQSGINKLTLPKTNVFPNADNVEITRYTDSIGGLSLGRAEIFSLAVDKENILWAGTARGVLAKNLNDSQSVFKEVPYVYSEHFKKEHRFWNRMTSGGRAIFEDHAGELWMVTRLGLFQLNRELGLFEQLQIQDTTFLISGHITATSFLNRNRQEIWMGTANGLFIIDPVKKEYVALPGLIDDHGSAHFEQIISFFVDKSGTIWAGTSGSGIGLFNPYTMKFPYPDETFVAPDGKRVSTRDLSIRAFCETTDESNYLWLGTAQGLFRVNRDNETLEEIVPASSPAHGMFSVFSIEKDQDNVLWMGTTWGLVRYDYRADSLTRYPTQLRDGDQSGEPRASKVHISNGDIWILTPNTIALLDQETGTFEHIRYNHAILNRFRDAVYPFVYEDTKGNFWLGTSNGLHYFDVKTRELLSYKNDPLNLESLPFNDVRAIIPDPVEPHHFLWLATGGGGLVRFDMQQKTFARFSEYDGLANNMVYGLLLDHESGEFWMSTNQGLSRFNLWEQRFTNYTIADGLQSNEFNSGAFYKSRAGEMFFGGIKGYNSFFPSGIHHKEFSPPIVFTAFILLKGAENKNQPIYNITETSVISLKHNQNNFSIAFSSLDFAAVHANQFSYSFTKSGEHWINLGHNHSITFIDLKPGNYRLRVRGTNNDGVWSDHEAVLRIYIARPWWGRNLAYFIYLMFALAAVAGIRRYELTRTKMKNSMHLAELESGKLKELDSLKSKFFTNISHEFRTPLTLIKGPLHDMIEETSDPELKQVFTAMHKNTERLLELINQLLDLSKLESGEYRLKASAGDITAFVRGCVLSLSSRAEQKQINMQFMESSSMKEPIWKNNFYFDPDVMEKILINLLSNALKFTPPHGRVTVNLCPVMKKGISTAVEIVIKDTGIGIAADKLPLIYNRFYQVDDNSNRKHEGTGIGLAYVKELVDIHKGQISAMSKPGRGTVFRLKFPLGQQHYSKEQLFDEKEQHKSNMMPVYDVKTEQINHKQLSEQRSDRKVKPVVLLVEDHEDVRAYLSRILKKSYVVLEASHGRQGLEIAAAKIPDLIISDVMMPGMDGYEFCKRIKTGDKTSHIPLVLLTSRVEEKDLLHGLENGADDYLTKPFNSRELKMRIGNLIQSRRKLREMIEENALVKPADISVTSRDRAFVEKLLKLVEKNMDNEHFSVEELAQAAGMSASQLNRKLKALLNQSAIQFIRSLRMHRAKELLEKDAGNIAEIAYMVGFSDPGYFSKTFRKFFGKRPSEISS